MSVPAPHFLLRSRCGERKTEAAGHWRFELESADGKERFEAAEAEPDIPEDRLALLAVVRGLEALDQPSRVTLMTHDGYVAHGFRHGLGAWRENNWRWEKFGKMAPVKNDDLWRRVDRAMTYHTVDFRGSGTALSDLVVTRPQPTERRQRKRRGFLGLAGKLLSGLRFMRRS